VSRSSRYGSSRSPVQQMPWSPPSFSELHISKDGQVDQNYTFLTAYDSTRQSKRRPTTSLPHCFTVAKHPHNCLRNSTVLKGTIALCILGCV
jgi:hypothetical protein